MLLTAFAMYCVRWFLIIPILKTCRTDEGYYAPYLNEGWFVLLVLSVLFINAAGYVINDYCDVETDLINKPEKVFITKSISYSQAATCYYCLNILGIILGIMVSLKINSLKFSSIHLAAVGLLWLYAMQLKKKPIVGNIAVVMLSALVMLLPIIYEPIVFYNAENNFQTQVQIILSVGLIFAAFAMLTQWIREMIKDLQDVEGDKLTGCNTLPIWLSIKSTKIFLSVLIAITLFSVGWFQFHFYVHRKFYPVFNLWNLFTIVLIQLPLLVVLVKLWQADKSQQYKVLSTIMKVVMFAGIFSMLFIQQWFQQYFN